MRAERKKILVIAGGVIALIVIAAAVAVSLFDINSYKLKIETVASEATGLDVGIKGKMGLSFFPFGFSAKEIHIAGKGGEILSLEQLKLGVELIPLLKKQLKVTSCELVKPTITVVKDTEGKYNFESGNDKSKKGLPGKAFSLKDLHLSKGEFVYLDKKTGEKTEWKKINLAVNDLTVEGTGTSGGIIQNVSFTGNMDCREVLQKDVRIENFKGFAKASKGIYSFQPLTIGSFVSLNRKTGEKTELKEINLAVKDLTIENSSGEIIKHAAFTGHIGCKELRRKDLKIKNIASSLKTEKGIFLLKPFTMDIFGAKGEGYFIADKSEADASYTINMHVPNLDFEKLEESFGMKKIIGGKGYLSTSLTVKTKEGRTLLNGMSGTLSLQGNNLVTYTVDLDKVLSAYEANQKFSLVDIGVFFITGPFGSVALKGYDYGNLYYQTQGGQGTITKFVSHWKIRNGVADSADCALATRHNRVALKGKLNFVSDRYDNITVALLDDQGCAKYSQNITGPFGAPKVGVVSKMESLAGPIMDLYRQAKRFVQGGRCQAFYQGSVQQPR